MKSVLLSVRPEWVAKILNGEKTIEIRKKFPSDYVGWVYIYVTHGKQLLDLRNVDTKDNYRLTERKSNNVRWSYPPLLNSKVVARFWCDKVEEIKLNLATRFFTKSMNEEELLKQSCLTSKELENYLWSNICCGKAIHITRVETFDKPKEIIEFYNYLNCSHSCFNCLDNHYVKKCNLHKLTRAPQSYCFIEIGE